MSAAENHIHAEVIASLKDALAHLDMHALHVPAAQLHFIIESIEQHVEEGCYCGEPD